MDVHAQTSGGLELCRHRLSSALKAILGGALLISLTLNVFLAHRIRSFELAREVALEDRLVKVGVSVPPITAKRVDGKREVISYEGTSQPTVLYVFTPTCSWCARNMSNLKTLLNNGGDSFRFVGLSLSDEGVAQYLAKNELKIPVYFGLSADARKAYKLGGTPQTIVVSPEGRVLQNWVGAYVGPQKSQVEAFFHTALPGLTESSNATPARNY